METTKVKFYKEEPGFHRIYYKPVNRRDKRLFCNQKSLFGYSWYLCSPDGEPAYEVKGEIEILDGD